MCASCMCAAVVDEAWVFDVRGRPDGTTRLSSQQQSSWISQITGPTQYSITRTVDQYVETVCMYVYECVHGRMGVDGSVERLY